VLVTPASQLERAAADVENQQPPGRPAAPPPRREEGVAGLVRARQQLQRDPGLRPDASGDRVAVRRVTQREVAKASTSTQPAAVACAAARPTASTSASAPSSVSRPEASIRSASRSSVFSDVIGAGRAPRWASTTSRWTVLEPTSRTPSRIDATSAPSGWERRRYAAQANAG